MLESNIHDISLVLTNCSKSTIVISLNNDWNQSELTRSQMASRKDKKTMKQKRQEGNFYYGYSSVLTHIYSVADWQIDYENRRAYQQPNTQMDSHTLKVLDRRDSNFLQSLSKKKLH